MDFIKVMVKIMVMVFIKVMLVLDEKQEDLFFMKVVIIQNLMINFNQ